MKHLSKQSSLPSQHPSSYSSSKTNKRSLPRTNSLGQRLLLVLLGALIASTIFLLHPYLHPQPTSTSTPTYTTAASLSSSSRLPAVHLRRPSTSTLLSGAKRVPVGLKRPSKRVVVTGGAGFVGSHLVDRLLERGDSVIVIDNFFTGRKENVMHHLGDPRFELIRHDVVEPILLEVDQIYHLACPASPVHYKYNPIKTIISFLHSNISSFFFFFLVNLDLYRNRGCGTIGFFRRV